MQGYQGTLLVQIIKDGWIASKPWSANLYATFVNGEELKTPHELLPNFSSMKKLKKWIELSFDDMDITFERV